MPAAGVVLWVHEIDLFIGWRARCRVPALGAWFHPPGMRWKTQPHPDASSSSVTQAEAKHRLTENPLPHPLTCFPSVPPLWGTPCPALIPDETYRKNHTISNPLSDTKCVCFRYTERFWKSDTSWVSLCYTPTQSQRKPSAVQGPNTCGLGPHRAAPASWASDPPAINQSSHNPLPGLMFCQNGSQNSGKLLLTLPHL